MRKLSSLCARSSNDYQIYLAYFHPNSWLDQGWTVEFIYYAFKLGFVHSIRHSSTFYRKQNFTLQHSRGKCNGNFHWIDLWFVKTPLGSATYCCFCTGTLGHRELLVFPIGGHVNGLSNYTETIAEKKVKFLHSHYIHAPDCWSNFVKITYIRLF